MSTSSYEAKKGTPTAYPLTHVWTSLQLNWRRLWDSWDVFKQNRLAVFGAILIVVYAVMAIAHPVLMKTVWTKTVYDPRVGYDMRIFPHPSPPSATHLLGTDALGRDVLSMLLSATTPTFVLALTAALTTAFFGTLSGAISAYYGRGVNTILAHLSDIALLAPAPLVMIAIGGVVDIRPVHFGLLYGFIAGIGGAAIVMRAQALTIVNRPYVDAARIAGAGGGHIIFHHLIPNMLPLSAVQMLLSVTGAVFADGFSTFLGLQRTRLNWGSMIYESITNQGISTTIAWNVLIPAATTISLFAAAFYFIARGVHEVAEPQLRKNRF